MAIVIKIPEDLGRTSICSHAEEEEEDLRTSICSHAEEEEEDLFEIDLQAVDNIPAPHYYWEEDGVHFVNITRPTTVLATLFANCLLPASYVSGAVPLPDTADSGKLCVGRSLSMLAMSDALIGSQPLAMTLGKLLELPFPGRE